MPTIFSGCARRVIVSRDEIRAFNASWPASELRDSRTYWFEYDESGDLVDTDVPESDDGAAAAALADDCRAWMEWGDWPEWGAL